jgi:protein-tyrosine phosphatase
MQLQGSNARRYVMSAAQPVDVKQGDSRIPFRILIVCTGNVCRSPVAEQVLQRWLNEVSPGAFSVRSAGTKALAGSPMTRAAARQLAAVTPAEPFSAEQLKADMLPAQNLILGMARGHRSEIVQMHSGALKRTFTLREFGRMVEHLHFSSLPGNLFSDDPFTRWYQLVSLAPSVRPDTLAAAEADDDVTDPYKRNAAAYAQMLDEMMPALKSLRAFEESHQRGRVRST